MEKTSYSSIGIHSLVLHFRVLHHCLHHYSLTWFLSLPPLSWVQGYVTGL